MALTLSLVCVVGVDGSMERPSSNLEDALLNRELEEYGVVRVKILASRQHCSEELNALINLAK